MNVVDNGKDMMINEDAAFLVPWNGATIWLSLKIQI